MIQWRLEIKANPYINRNVHVYSSLLKIA
jgi:hypothetical protein